MAIKVYVTLSPEVRKALERSAQEDLRETRDQIHFILREELIDRGTRFHETCKFGSSVETPYTHTDDPRRV